MNIYIKRTDKEYDYLYMNLTAYQALTKNNYKEMISIQTNNDDEFYSGIKVELSGCAIPNSITYYTNSNDVDLSIFSDIKYNLINKI